MSKPSIATMVETHLKVNVTIIEVDNQTIVIQVQVGKNIVEDVLIDRGANVNIIIENFKTKLGLPKTRPTPYHLRMANQSMTKPLGIIKKLKIHIHGIPYITTFTILKNNVVDSSYYMLLGRLGLEVQWLHMIGVTMSLLFKVME
jgi:hypothetical protein